jgi:adenylylsulfate kinase-like enzyme
MILWFTGISGVGKTTIAKYIYKKLKKRIKNLVHIDGDNFREMFNNDLGYKLKDRDKNAVRLINFIRFLSKQKINIIVSANLTSQKYRQYCKKNLKNFYEINISSDLSNLKKRDTKNIYKKNLSEVVGFGIKNIKNNTASHKIINNNYKNEFLSNSKKIIKKIKDKVI